MNADLQRSLLVLLCAAGLAGGIDAQSAREGAEGRDPIAGAGAAGARQDDAARAGDANVRADRIAAVRAAYGVAAWPAGALRDGVPLATLELAGYRGGALSSSGALVGRDFVAADAPRSATPAFHVEARVFDDAAGAHELLVGWLAGLSSPTPAPEDGAFGIELGEAGYVGPSGSGERVLSWVAFVRGNVAVRLLNVDPARTPAPALLELAQTIDSAIAQRPHLAGEAAVPRPEIATLATPATASESPIEAGERVKLDVVVVDPTGGTPTLQWSVGGTGQGYVESRPDGWYLFTTGPGEVTVTLAAIGSTATTAERSLTLHVADD